MIRRSLLSLFLAVVLVVPALAAPSPNDQASLFIQEVVGNAVTAMTQENLTHAEQEARFRELFTKYIDIKFIGAFVTGRFWRTAPQSEKDEFLKLLEDVTVLSWASRIAAYASFGMEVLGPKETQAQDLFIETVFTPKEGPSVNVIWRLAPQDASFIIRDIVIEGASLAMTHRDEYTSVIRNNDGKLAGLNEALTKKVEQLRQP